MIISLSRRKLVFLAVILFFHFLGKAQAPNASTGPGTGSVTKHVGTNYTFTSASNVRLWDVTKPITAEQDVLSYAGFIEMVKQTTQYVDSLGRPIQTVLRGITTTGKDLVTPVEYDALGREVYKYMPYVTSDNQGGFKSTAFTDQDNFLSSFYAGDNYFYGQTDYEASPLNRVVKTYAQGISWAGKAVGTGISYGMNTAVDAIRIWNIELGSGSLPTSTASYSANLLFKTTSADENGNQVIEFKDKDGNVILKKVQADASTWLSTYYVYDDVGRLRFVIPPKAVAYLSDVVNNPTPWQFESSTWSGSTVAQELCFSYEYDSEGKMIIKRVPGAGEVYMVYDVRDRLVLTQDQNMRVSPVKWLYTKYDALNRPVKTGLWTTATSFATLQTNASTSTNYPQPTSGDEPLTESYYDNYDWVAGSGSGFSGFATKNTSNNDYFYTTDNNNFPYPQALTPNYQVLGAVTGTKTKVLGSTSDFLYAVSFYDDRNRVIQTQSTNYGNGYSSGNMYKDTITTQYSFSGQVLATLVAHKKGGASTQLYKVSTLNVYDGAGRLSEVYKKVGNSLKTKISQNDYDELGQLKQKKLGQQRTSLTDYTYTATPIDILKYDYNVRGWLRGINKDYARNEGSADSWFGMEIDYDFGFTANQLNGNISGTRWRSKGDGEQRAYGFNYDKANRLLTGDFNQLSGSTWDKLKTDFSTTNLTYDENGNIKSMIQKGMKLNKMITIDDLTYNYTANPTTNKLYYVKDAQNDAASTLGDFKEITSNTDQDYWYDDNGNLTKDFNKGIGSTSVTGITYNYLNLPSVISIPGKGTITYLYDAAGNKLQKTTVDNVASPSITTVTKYVKLFTYQNDTLQFIAQEEGRIRPITHKQSDTMYYDYFEKDHLGNVRVVLTDQKKQDVYPVATLETNTNALTTEKMYYDIVNGNIQDNVTTLFDASGPSNTVYQNHNGNPPYNNNPYATTSANSSRMYKLNGTTASKRSGLGITIKVMTGDVIDIYGKSYYFTNGATPNNSYSLLESAAFNALMAMFAGSSAVSIGSHGASASDLLTNPGTQSGAQDLIGSMPTPTNRPKASINWALLDEQFQVVSSNCGSDGVSSTSDLLKDHHRVVNISKNGYLYVYCSNESDIDVFFDNLQVIHTRGPLLEETHYYPFGLTMQGISSKAAGSLDNKRKWNKGSELESKEFSDGSGLELYSTFYRSLDPQLGRFWQIDPKPNYAQSLYSSMDNNPILKNDPLGDTTIVDKYGNITKVYGSSNLVFMQSGKKLKPIGEIGGKIDANEIMTNLLRTHKQFAKGMGTKAWIQKVLPGHDWDLKANTNTIFGAAWKYDATPGKTDKTNFSFGSNNMNAADVGNYHAGYTGTIAGVPTQTQYTLAGLGEFKKDVVDKHNFGSALVRFAQMFSMPTGAPSFPGVVSNYTPMSKPMVPYGDQQRDYEMNTLGMQDAAAGK